jgi:hypothetical protein
MNRIDGTAARQLDLLDDTSRTGVADATPRAPRTRLRLLQRDIYSELARRRRRAQIAARRAAGIK